MLANQNNNPSFEELSTREWLATNGIGGYASSTVVGANTRRYHGLLVAALEPPAGRSVMVSKVEECIVFNRDCVFALSSNQYPGTVHPRGFQYFKFFERKPLPSMKFEAQGHHLLKTVFMVHGSNTTVVEYENTGDTSFQLRLSPLLVFRDYHSLFREDGAFDFWMQRRDRHFTLYARYGAPALHFNFTAGEFVEQRNWYKNLEYAREKERGLDYREDAFSPFYIDVVLKPGDKTHLVFSLDEKMMSEQPGRLKLAETERLAALIREERDDPFFRDLLLAGDQFLVRRGERFSLLAGYHWFADWGRDTMIAMRGLTIATGKQDISRSILETFLQYVNRGMLPNRFPDQGQQPEYNTIDATLWLFIALYEYSKKFQDMSLVAEHFDTLTDILNQHIAGTRYNIHVTPEGFLSGGEGLSQLTWMDARIGDYVVTPRHGCPVEIQALWYNALRIYQNFAGIIGQPYADYQAIADNLKGNFKAFFLRPDGSLQDVVVPGAKADPAIRPNQIYVVSLPFSLLSPEEEKGVVSVVCEHLLTDYGLRSLSPEHPDFRPTYGGDPWQRDTAYHQGTVWPFLLSEYVTAFLKVNDWSEKAQKDSLALLEPLKRHFYQDGCILGVAEIFDGKMPREGKGAVQQAWSVGALIKILSDLRLHRTHKRKPGKIPFTAVRSMIF